MGQNHHMSGDHHPLTALTIHINHWLVVFRPTPLKNDGVKVSWDDDIPNMMGKS
jgi:hypothetical protein